MVSTSPVTLLAIVSLLSVSPFIRGLHAEERWSTLPVPPPMQAPAKSGYAPVNGIEMYYAVYGILLIHGGLGNADVWSNQIPKLAENHTVIIADSRGHGRSTRNEQPYNFDLMASDFPSFSQRRYSQRNHDVLFRSED